jgi:hypothetical protein
MSAQDEYLQRLTDEFGRFLREHSDLAEKLADNPPAYPAAPDRLVEEVEAPGAKQDVASTAERQAAAARYAYKLSNMEARTASQQLDGLKDLEPELYRRVYDELVKLRTDWFNGKLTPKTKRPRAVATVVEGGRLLLKQPIRPDLPLDSVKQAVLATVLLGKGINPHEPLRTLYEVTATLPYRATVRELHWRAMNAAEEPVDSVDDIGEGGGLGIVGTALTPIGCVELVERKVWVVTPAPGTWLPATALWLGPVRADFCLSDDYRGFIERL